MLDDTTRIEIAKSFEDLAAQDVWNADVWQLSLIHICVDAEAYDEFGKAMQAMCRFVKPILSMVPPDPHTLNPVSYTHLQA